MVYLPTQLAGCDICCGVVTTGEDLSRDVRRGEAGGAGVVAVIDIRLLHKT